jgi:hypothetical protein
MDMAFGIKHGLGHGIDSMTHTCGTVEIAAESGEE